MTDKIDQLLGLAPEGISAFIATLTENDLIELENHYRKIGKLQLGGKLALMAYYLLIHLPSILLYSNENLRSTDKYQITEDICHGKQHEIEGHLYEIGLKSCLIYANMLRKYLNDHNQPCKMAYLDITFNAEGIIQLVIDGQTIGLGDPNYQHTLYLDEVETAFQEQVTAERMSVKLCYHRPPMPMMIFYPAKYKCYFYDKVPNTHVSQLMEYHENTLTHYEIKKNMNRQELLREIHDYYDKVLPYLYQIASGYVKPTDNPKAMAKRLENAQTALLTIVSLSDKPLKTIDEIMAYLIKVGLVFHGYLRSIFYKFQTKNDFDAIYTLSETK